MALDCCFFTVLYNLTDDKLNYDEWNTGKKLLFGCIQLMSVVFELETYI